MNLSGPRVPLPQRREEGGAEQTAIPAKPAKRRIRPSMKKRRLPLRIRVSDAPRKTGNEKLQTGKDIAE